MLEVPHTEVYPVSTVGLQPLDMSCTTLSNGLVEPVVDLSDAQLSPGRNTMQDIAGGKRLCLRSR